MNRVPLTEVDEVWLAIEQAYGSLLADGHKPAATPFDCRSCYVVGLLKRAMDVYRERRSR